LLFAMLTGLFVLTYQFVPNVKIVWQNVLLGATATAFLFSVSRLLLLQYFSYSYLNTMFGAASAAVILLLWAYYSMSVFLLGAEFTYIHSQTYGRWWRETGSSPESLPSKNETLNGLERPSTEETRQRFAKMQSQILMEKPLSAAFSTPEQIEFLEIFARQAEMSAIVNEEVLEDASFVDAVEKRSWFSKVIRRNQKPQPLVTTENVEAVEEQTRRRLFNVFSRSKNKASKKISNPITRTRQRFQAARSRFLQIVTFPLRVIRPVREIALAVSVIGAISIAAVIGLPLWRKKDPTNVDELIDLERSE